MLRPKGTGKKWQSLEHADRFTFVATNSASINVMYSSGDWIFTAVSTGKLAELIGCVQLIDTGFLLEAGSVRLGDVQVLVDGGVTFLFLGNISTIRRDSFHCYQKSVDKCAHPRLTNH